MPLDSPNIVIGTITLGGDDFIMRIKGRGDIEMHEVTQENTDPLPDLILDRICASGPKNVKVDRGE
jgi:hypothetical protein